MAIELEPKKRSSDEKAKVPETATPPKVRISDPWIDDDSDEPLEFHPDEDPYGPCYDPD